MIRSLNSELIPLQPKVPLKNIHLAHQLYVYQNQQIFIVYQSSVHIHSISNIIATLPSLVYTLDLQQLALRIPTDLYQDDLTKQITTTEKGELGEVIFSSNLEQQQNAFLRGQNVRGRLKFLMAEFIVIKDLQISNKGHLLITFQDGRSLFIQRNHKSIGFTGLYETQNIHIMNKSSEAPIVKSILLQSMNNERTQILQLMKNPTNPHQLNLCKCLLELDTCEIEKVDIVLNHKKIILPSKGLINVDQFNCNNSQCIAVVYLNKIYLIELTNKSNNKNQLSANNVKVMDLSQLFESEFIINSKYDAYTNKLYVYSSQNVGMVGLSAHQQQNGDGTFANIKMKSKSKSNSLDLFASLKISRLHKVGKFSPKTNIGWVGDQGNFIENSTQYIELFTQTDNGLIVKLGPTTSNYKEGYLNFYHLNPLFLIQKMVLNVKMAQKMNFCLNFSDLRLLQTGNNWETLKKDILNELSQINKQVKQTKKEEDNEEISQKIVNILIVNLLLKFNSKVNVAEKIIKAEVSEMGGRQGRCFVSGKAILSEDVMECKRCNLFALKQECERKSIMKRCPICWNQLFQIS